ncbi:hypothetical protein ACP4OV_030726 [Aristida adscensionis]
MTPRRRRTMRNPKETEKTKERLRDRQERETSEQRLPVAADGLHVADDGSTGRNHTDRQDINLELKMPVERNSSTTNIQDAINRLFSEKGFQPLIIILPDFRAADGMKSERSVIALERCITVFYGPLYAANPDKEYARGVVNELLTKVLLQGPLPDPCDAMDIDSEAPHGSGEQTSQDDDGYENTSSSDESSSDSDETDEEDFYRNSSGSDEKIEEMIDLAEPKEVERPFPCMVKGNVQNWACVCFASIRDYKAERFFVKIRNKCWALGMDVPTLPVMCLVEHCADSTSIEDNLWYLYSEITRPSNTKLFGRELDLLIVIPPDQGDCRAKVMELCNNMGVVYQLCSPEDAREPKKRYMFRTAREIRTKVVERETGRKLPSVCKPIPFTSEATIVLGADTSQSKSGEGDVNIASVVASMNWPEVSKYKCCCRIQPYPSPYSSAIDGLYSGNGGMVGELLKKFSMYTNKNPQKIIFFRFIRQSERCFMQEDYLMKFKCLSDREVSAIKKYMGRKHHQQSHKWLRREVIMCLPNFVEQGMLKSQTLDPARSQLDLDSADDTGCCHYHCLLDENSFGLHQLELTAEKLCTPYHRYTYKAMNVAPPVYFACEAADTVRRYVEEKISSGPSDWTGHYIFRRREYIPSQGCCHYHCLLDENNFSPRQLELITENLCTPYHGYAYKGMNAAPPVYFACEGADTVCRYVEEQICIDPSGPTADPATVKLPYVKLF